MPWAVARGIGEAVTDQEMACLLFAQEVSGISKSGTSTSVPWPFFAPKYRASAARTFGTKSIPGTDLELLAPQAPSRGEGGGNVRGAAVGRPPTGRPASPGAATGWGIPPDPQQPKTGGILVR